MTIMQVGRGSDIKNPCCETFAQLYHYNYYNFDPEEAKFSFENEEEDPLKYCMFCGKRLVVMKGYYYE